MIKGITKSIIEVSPRSHDYFEKLIIILKNTPDMPDEDELRRYALLMAGQKPPSCVSRRRGTVKCLLFALMGAVTALLCCALVLLFV